MSEDIAELARLARSVAEDAAQTALRGQAGVSVAETKSSPVDVVTAMDRACEAQIRAALVQARPDDGFVGEESAASGGTSGLRWIVDPIDGTVNYLYGIPNWCVSVAVADADGTLAGAVVAPMLGETYWAGTGMGSYLVTAGGEQRLACADNVPLEQALVATGFGYLRDRRIDQARILSSLLPDIRDIRRCGSAALDLCWVAHGRVNASYEQGLNEWDRAAGALIAEEAGAVVGGLFGQPGREFMTLAAEPGLYAELNERLEDLMADPEYG